MRWQGRRVGWVFGIDVSPLLSGGGGAVQLERGDLEEAVNAARQIGDDRLQRSQGRVPMPHTFTHGTSEQRARWFQTGYESGRLQTCDTFSARTL